MNARANVSLAKFGPIEVFRAGSFQSMDGSTQTITEANLREIAAIYDRNAAPAPIVIGHPQADTPAFGWVEGLYVERGILKATIEDTVTEFAELVRAGRYRRVSISLFLPSSRNNPKPGNLYLKHVGFLGAAAPAVPGLKPVKFAGGVSDSIQFSQAQLVRDDELTRLRRQVREQEIEQLIGQGRVLPLFKEEVIAFAASLDDAETVSFSEGTSSTRKDWFLSYLSRQPQVVSFGSFDMGDDPSLSSQMPRPALGIPDGYQADPKQQAMYVEAQALARAKGVSFSEAVDLILTGAPR